MNNEGEITQKQYNVINYFLVIDIGLKGNTECVQNLKKLFKSTAYDIIKDIYANRQEYALKTLYHWGCISEEDKKICLPNMPDRQ